ncbi:MAG: Gfo/Idh/MocA family oxidoreductase [Nitrosarchaeum sp.]|nr:Gfo/Idh/MocA family oxidoreductase [Nitrosarchaeum sp.]
MQKKHVLVVGCGNLGSRHLQGIVKISSPLEISVVEPNQNSINIAKDRLNEVPEYHHTISWYDDVSNISQPSDLVIVSTNSLGRSTLIQQLLKNNHSRFLIEKIVCQSKEEYESLLKELSIHNAKGWVDTSKRYFPFYMALKENFSQKKPVHFSVKTGNIGLGTNAIHFLDLFLWFTNSTHIELTENLHNEILQNKRGKNFVEFAGIINGKSNSNSTINITSSLSENLPILVDIESEDKQITIDETNQKIIKSENLPNIPFKWMLQSELTSSIVMDILKNDDCHLPSVQDSFVLHTELFRIFNNHINKIQNKQPSLCPIT